MIQMIMTHDRSTGISLYKAVFRYQLFSVTADHDSWPLNRDLTVQSCVQVAALLSHSWSWLMAAQQGSHCTKLCSGSSSVTADHDSWPLNRYLTVQSCVQVVAPLSHSWSWLMTAQQGSHCTKLCSGSSSSWSWLMAAQQGSHCTKLYSGSSSS